MQKARRLRPCHPRSCIDAAPRSGHDAMVGVHDISIGSLDDFQTGVGWAHSILLVGPERFGQEVRIVSLSDDVSIGLNAFRGSFHITGLLDERRMQLLFIESLGTEISRVQSYRHVSEAACLAFGGNHWEAVSDRASKGVAINVSGRGADWIRAMVAPHVREIITSRSGDRAAQTTMITPAGRKLKQRLLQCAGDLATWRRLHPDGNAGLYDAMWLHTQQKILLELAACAIEEMFPAPGPTEAMTVPQRLELATRVSGVLASSPRDRHDEWSLLEMAAHFHVAPRTIQAAMQEAFGVGFAGFRKLMRLHQLRHALRSAPAKATVTQIAHEHFFMNPGRMAGEYKILFGSMPAQDIDRVKSIHFDDWCFYLFDIFLIEPELHPFAQIG